MSPAALARRRTAIPVVAVTAVAWIAILIRSGGVSSSTASCCVPISATGSISWQTPGMLFAGNPLSVLLVGWALMLVAMMAPLIVAPVRHVLDRSLSKRRLRSVLLFLAGTFGVWMAAGVVILTLVMLFRALMPNSIAQIFVVGAIAFVWQCSPAKQMCLNRGHAHPELPAFGRAADIGALRFGIVHGYWCVGSCWALMWLSEMFVAGHMLAMALVTVWVLAEHLERPSPPKWRLRGLSKGMRIASAQTQKLLRPIRCW